MSLEYKDSINNMGGHSVSPKMQCKESFSGSGSVYVREFKMVDGEKVYTNDPPFKANLIVQLGRASLIDLLIGAKRQKLSFIRWGKGGAPAFPDGDPLLPYEVQDTDDNVRIMLLDKQLNTPQRLSPTQIEYEEVLISDEVNDDVNEAAMMFENLDTLARTIFARITFPTIRLTVEKGSGIELRWIFNFDKSEEEPV